MAEASIPPLPLTAEQRRAMLAMRQWTPLERGIVMRGLLGRLAIAAEPLIIAVLFGFFAYALLRLGSDGKEIHHGLTLFTPIFGLGALAFLIYAAYLLARPLRALRETYEPIFVVDGYLRTRGRDDFSERGFSGYVAVLLSDRRVACEWPSVGTTDVSYSEFAALCEFSEYGGIHSIDGRPTGVLPKDFSNIGVGTNRSPRL